MQFRIMDLLLTVWVWGNATGLMYLGTRWMVKPHAAQPTFSPLALAVLFVICGLWALEGSWWALSREKEIQSVLGWQRRWLMLMMGWMRVPVGFSGVMLTFMVPTWSVTMFYTLDRLNSTTLIIFGILTLLMLLCWIFIFYWSKIRKQYLLKFPPRVKYDNFGARGVASQEYENDEDDKEGALHKNI